MISATYCGVEESVLFVEGSYIGPSMSAFGLEGHVGICE